MREEATEETREDAKQFEAKWFGVVPSRNSP